MRRREFFKFAGGAAALGALPRQTSAQQPAKIPTIGFLCPTSAGAWTAWTKAFVDRLTELGWIDGRTVTIVFRWADGHERALRRTCGGNSSLARSTLS